MNSDPVGYDYGPNLSALYRAWEAHYERKGCSPRKAREVAYRKVRTQGARAMPVLAKERAE